MKATVVDLRYNMKDVIRSLDRNEPVTVMYHGKPKGTIVPVSSSSSSVRDHAFFGMSADKTEESVDQVMNRLRASPDHAV
ncbi:MAG: type II toxin-antitoxin system Phd/YefM family antitoxin [Spirochaetaceae bacterium]|nr:MAG: type II toxin-antitoxin system Phd/YefM family antitoxin [Spirochaetaceae bacterium]